MVLAFLDMGWCGMRLTRVFGLLAAIAALAGCASVPEPVAEIRPVSALTLDAGDQLTITVLGQADLSGTYTINDTGSISMPLVGTIGARGRTATGLEGVIEAALRNGFLRDPDVTVQVAQYRPVFVMGEVANAGQYPYVVGLTVQQAVAIAGGFGPRAHQLNVDIVRQAGTQSITLRVDLDTQVLPGDTITVRQRLF